MYTIIYCLDSINRDYSENGLKSLIREDQLPLCLIVIAIKTSFLLVKNTKVASQICFLY